MNMENKEAKNEALIGGSGLERLPVPDCIYADHSYPAYSAKAMRDAIKAEAVRMRSNMADEIADYLLEDHMSLMEENAALRHKLDSAMSLLAKLRDEKNYPKGGYSNGLQVEWDVALDSHYGEVRPAF